MDNDLRTDSFWTDIKTFIGKDQTNKRTEYTQQIREAEVVLFF